MFATEARLRSPGSTNNGVVITVPVSVGAKEGLPSGSEWGDMVICNEFNVGYAGRGRGRASFCA